eukprot:TRINITY_DN27075_c0_g1_i6.p1 TRINITY_DN27075_c0_g1~~TRINITY_DN27075_c0_g1_i6.p1  ORF type:complete len:159 (-),score=36.51 TRINITY_DN27075_c0_g1_i6:92-568(-)
MIRRPPRSTLSSSSAASDVYKRQVSTQSMGVGQRAMAGVGLYHGAPDTTSEITEEVDDWLDKTEADLSYMSDEEIVAEMDTADFRRVIADKDRVVKSLRGQLTTAKRIVRRHKSICQETNKELTEALKEVLSLREKNQQLEVTLECLKQTVEMQAKGR